MSVDAKTFHARPKDKNWMRIVKEVDPASYELLMGCGRMFWTAKCLGQEQHTTHVKNMCRKDSLCSADSYRRTMELTEDLVRVVREICLAARAKERFWRWEVTVPPDMRRRMTLADLDEVAVMARKYVEGYLKSFLRIERHESVRMGTLVVPSFIHSSDPFGMRKEHAADRRHFHVHGVTFGFGVNVADDSIVRFDRMFIDDDKNFVRFRAGWRELLEARFGKSDAVDMDLFVRYESGEDELRHRVRYMFRGNVEDFERFVRRYGYPEGYDVEHVRSALLEKNRRPRVRYYGWLSSRSLAKDSPFMKRLHVELPKKLIRIKQARKMYCDKCGCEMEIDYYGGLKTQAEIEAEGGTISVRLRRPLVFDGG